MGTATVRYDQGKLTIQSDASPMIAPRDHFHYDSFVATMPDAIMGKVPVTFRIGATGQVEGMTFPLGTTEWVKGVALFIMPPLCITKPQVEDLVERMDRTVREWDQLIDR